MHARSHAEAAAEAPAVNEAAPEPEVPAVSDGAEGQKVASGELEQAAGAVDESVDADGINLHSIELSGHLPDGAEVADFFMNS